MIVIGCLNLFLEGCNLEQNKIYQNLLVYVTFNHLLFPNLCFILLPLSPLYKAPEYDVTIHNLKLNMLLRRGCGKICRINTQVVEHRFITEQQT